MRKYKHAKVTEEQRKKKGLSKRSERCLEAIELKYSLDEMTETQYQNG